MAPIPIGTIVEIPTRIGFAYVQNTHYVPDMLDLITVFQPLFDRRPSDVGMIATAPVRFRSFMPLEVELERGDAQIVGRAAVNEENAVFPTFRSTSERPGDPPKPWWLWNGKRQWKVSRLTSEQLKLPFNEIISLSLLRSRIETDWTPESDQRSTLR